jgi:hypothetical protein
VDDPWGTSEPPAAVATGPLPPRLAALAAVTRRVPWDGGGFPRPEEVPEVAALVEQGWYALDDAPYVVGLPAVWPREHRCWVADRLPKVGLGNGTVEPWTAETYADMAADYAAFVAACGLPPRPEGRLWLVRSPWPGLSVPEVLDALHARLAERGLPQVCEHLTEVAREVLGWPVERVRSYLR